MIKTLQKHGNSRALVIDKALMELLGIQDDTPLSISTDGHNLIVTPVRDPEREPAFQQALEAVNQRHGKALKRLAE